MTDEVMIEEILMEAHSMGLRQLLIDRVSPIILETPYRRKVDIYEEVFQQILNEIENSYDW
jgi:hypothetical protein